jgi:hypothetical protein
LPAVDASPRGEPGALLRAVARGALDVERELDAALAAAARGATFSARELLGLQARVFRYSQTVEILSRGADRVVSAIRQALSTQV